MGTAFAMDELVKGIEENAAAALKDLPPQSQMTRGNRPSTITVFSLPTKSDHPIKHKR